MIKFEGQNENIAKLTTKLVAILSKCKAVKKSGMNKSQGYQYATEADILEVVRDQLVTNKIFVFSSANTKEIIKMDKIDYKTGNKTGDNILAVVNSEHAFVDGETGARIIVSGTGTGWDMTDKGVFKAITGLNKYMFAKNFMIESEDDPERDNANPGYVRGNTSTTKSTPANTRSFGKKKVVTEPVVKTEKKVEEQKVEAVTPNTKKSFGSRKFIKQEPNF